MLSVPFIGLHQKFGAQQLGRQPEMDVVMYDHEQDEQFTKDGEDGSLAVLYQLIVNVLLRRARHRGRALDLGCGSAQLLCKIAQAMPEMHFTGLDLSANMLRFAARTAEQHDVSNVEFLEGSWFDLDAHEPRSFDLVTWHLALHHCDTAEDVIRVVDNAARLVKPDGTVFLFDIIRPKSGRLAVRLADLYSLRWGSWFYQDTLDSYKAAFTYDELEDILRRSRLAGYVHVEPMFFNFWQMAFVSHHVDKAHPPVSNLRRLWQKRDYAMLKLCFGNRI
jgi:ubiquinone/menaquinone biosynthesis C-methylase UbiE